jgi:hypothetical protein
MAFGALSYCLSLLVSKDAPVFLILAGGFTGLVILAAVSWLVWGSEKELKKKEVRSAREARGSAVASGKNAGQSHASNDSKREQLFSKTEQEGKNHQ